MGRIKQLLKNINYLTKNDLWKLREDDIVFLTDKILDDGVYEYGLTDTHYKLPVILDCEHSLDLIISSGKSFVRMADGECKILMGMDQPFQKYEKVIADRLAELLRYTNDNVLVAIPRPYYYNYNQDVIGNVFHRRYSYEYRKSLNDYIVEDKPYLDTAVTNRKLTHVWQCEENDAFWERWKDVFEGKNLTIVCGENLLESFKYDIFEKAAEKRFIYGPRKNAWDKHDELIASICETVPTSDLVIFILGMAGKAMIPELAEKGYTCWDIGHMAKMYNAYMSGVDWTPEYRAAFYAPD